MMFPSKPAAPNSQFDLLDRPLPVFARVILLLICAFIPTAYIVSQYERQHDLTPVLSFGEYFQAKELPEIRAMKPAVMAGPGFDGQFYAQIALDPMFRRPDLAGAIDNPGVRGQRILLPAVAHVLGLGKPSAVIFIYAALNLFFWYLLLAVLVRRLPVASPRSFLVLFAIMWSTGTLISIESALSDLPAATLGFIALTTGEVSAALLIALAILTKPTCGLFILRFLTPFPRTFQDMAKKAGWAVLALILPVLWQLYLFHALDARAIDDSQFTYPFVGFLHRLAISWGVLASSTFPHQPDDIIPWGWNLFELLALLSITVQCLFLLLRPRWRSPLWLVGVSFVVLFLILSDKNYDAQVSYTRTVLPITLAFNFLLMNIRPNQLFFLLLIAGNAGLFEGVVETLLRTWS